MQTLPYAPYNGKGSDVHQDRPSRALARNESTLDVRSRNMYMILFAARKID